jgi:hypothetical protein
MIWVKLVDTAIFVGTLMCFLAWGNLPRKEQEFTSALLATWTRDVWVLGWIVILAGIIVRVLVWIWLDV